MGVMSKLPMYVILTIATGLGRVYSSTVRGFPAWRVEPTGQCAERNRMHIRLCLPTQQRRH